MNTWKKVEGHYFTPGGDPLWECPECGYKHLYGVENADEYKHECPNCTIKLRYPWEKEEDTR